MWVWEVHVLYVSYNKLYVYTIKDGGDPKLLIT